VNKTYNIRLVFYQVQIQIVSDLSSFTLERYPCTNKNFGGFKVF